MALRMDRRDLIDTLALGIPLAARLHVEDPASATQRLILLALALGVAYAWALLFARGGARPLGPGLPAFALTFAVMVPAPVPLTEAAIAVSFGAVFGREVFGARGVFPPALIGLAFALFSFPESGFEVRNMLGTQPDALFAAACLGSATILALAGRLAWEVAAAAVAGTVATALLLSGPAWWEHLGLGTFAAGIVFLAAAPDTAVAGRGARWFHGAVTGAMIVVLRIGNPAQPDSVVFAALLGALFAPLAAQAFAWRLRHG